MGTPCRAGSALRWSGPRPGGGHEGAVLLWAERQDAQDGRATIKGRGADLVGKDQTSSLRPKNTELEQFKSTDSGAIQKYIFNI